LYAYSLIGALTNALYRYDNLQKQEKKSHIKLYC